MAEKIPEQGRLVADVDKYDICPNPTNVDPDRFQTESGR